MHRDVLSVVLLPDSSVIGIQLCQISTQKCLAEVQIDGNGGDGNQPVRVGAHSTDHSVSQLFVWFSTLNVSIAYARGTDDSRHLDLTITPQVSDLFPEENLSDFAVAVTGR
jgi:hypothetical protein